MTGGLTVESWALPGHGPTDTAPYAMHRRVIPTSHESHSSRGIRISRHAPTRAGYYVIYQNILLARRRHALMPSITRGVRCVSPDELTMVLMMFRDANQTDAMTMQPRCGGLATTNREIRPLALCY